MTGSARALLGRTATVSLAACGPDLGPASANGHRATACYMFDQVIRTSRGTGTSTTSYAWAQGTSMAAPAVSGIVALLTQQHGTMHPSQVLARLQQGAADLGQPGKGTSSTVTGG